MIERYLPSLQKITIRNFSLYPGDLQFTYDFIRGVNLVIGGNGVGKTTFLNVIKFAIIGLYKKEMSVRRREYAGVERRYEGRVPLPYNFFSNRMDRLVNYNDEATVTLEYNLNKTRIEVVRNLKSTALTELYTTEGEIRKKIEGNVLTQKDYDVLMSDTKKYSKEISESLQGKYEQIVSDLSHLGDFGNLIFLLNDILFFNEERATIMWDSEFQDNFASIFLIDADLLRNLRIAKNDGKYFDSLSRHKSEDIRAIKKVFDRLKDNANLGKNYKDLLDQQTLTKRSDLNFFDTIKRVVDICVSKRK